MATVQAGAMPMGAAAQAGAAPTATAQAGVMPKEAAIRAGAAHAATAQARNPAEGC